MKRLVAFSILATATLQAVELSPIEVLADDLYAPLPSNSEILDQKTTLDAEALSLFGPKAQSSALMALDMAPGVNVESADAYGLSGSSMRERGVDSHFLGLTLEGIPVYAIRPIGPRVDIVDLENIETLDFYRGAQSPKNHTGVGSRGGLIDLRWRRPSDTSSTTIQSRLGSDAFYKHYLRIDSGRIADWPLQLFGSISKSGADKWKGEGDLEPRTNIALGAEVPSDALHVSLFYNHNEHERHDFMPLSYAQINSLDANYDLDYQSSEDNRSDYYDYHKSDNRYDDLSLHLEGGCFGLTCKLKLYGSSYLEKSDEGNGKGTVDALRTGMIASVGYADDIYKAEAGIWAERAALDKYVRKVSTTAQREHQGWKWLNKNRGDTQLLSPYLYGSAEFDVWRIEAGIRGMYYKEAANDTYLPNNTIANYEDAIANGTIAPGGHVDAMTYSLALPTLGMHYQLSEAGELFAKWGRGYQRPYRYSFAAAYGANKQGIRDKLQAQGKGLEDIVKQWKMEESDMFDLGGLYYWQRATLGVTLFYHRHKNLLSSAYDPTFGINYLQNVGNADVYGAELTLDAEVAHNLWLYCNPAWMHSAIEEDLNFGGNVVKLKGNAMSETPEFTLKTGALFRLATHTFNVTGRYIGSRYGDVENGEKIDGYFTLDARYGYRFGANALDMNGEVWIAGTNLLDEQYVSEVGSADMLDDTPVYYVGAPRSVMAGVELNF